MTEPTAPVYCASPEAPPCRDVDGLLYSTSHPDRAVQPVLLGYALFQKHDGQGVHMGLGQPLDAALWLQGYPVDDLPSALTVSHRYGKSLVNISHPTPDQNVGYGI